MRTHDMRRPRRSGATKIALAIGLLLAFSAGLLAAISISHPSNRMPLTLLLQRLGERLAANPADYFTHSALAKTHAMAAAWHMTSGHVVRAGGYDSALEPLFQCQHCAHVPYRTVPPPTHEQPMADPVEDWLIQGTADERRRAFHLEKAIEHYRDAIRLGVPEAARHKPGQFVAGRWVSPLDVQRERLGLAWNLIQLDTEEARDEARGLLRGIVENGGGAPRDWSAPPPIEAEAIDYLIPLLGPEDAEEIEQLQQRHDALTHDVRWETPLAIDLGALERPAWGGDERGGDAQATARPLVARDAAPVSFALDRRGPRLWTWPRRDVAWLVWIGDGPLSVTDSTQLFGNSTFGMAHRDGFEALCLLDRTGDGLLEADELIGLALWRDADRSGTSETTELLSLASLDIVGLRCARDLATTGDAVSNQSEDADHLVIARGVRLVDDREIALWDLFLVDQTGDGAKPPCPRALSQVLYATATR